MRILLVHGRYRTDAPSGENKVVDQESSALAAAGHDARLFQSHSDEIAGWSLPRKAAVPVQAVWNGEVRRDLARVLRQFRPDVVHVHNTFPLLSPTVFWACRDAGVPAVATLHNYRLVCASGDFFRNGRMCHDCVDGHPAQAVVHGCYRGSRSATLPVLANMVVHRSTWQRLVSAYIFISASQRDLMRGLQLPAERVFVKHNLVPPLPPTPRKPEHLVVYLGRMYETKGVPFLMRAWDCFRARSPGSSLRLVLAGGGDLDAEVRAWAARRCSVEVAGLLPPDETAALLARALAVVLPSQWQETFGLVAVEAMAAGVAPVAARRGSFPELVTDEVDGALFPPDDPEELARILDNIDRKPERYLEYGRQGRITYQKRFDPATNLEELLEIYRFAMKNPVG